jgi:hypothetical protein
LNTRMRAVPEVAAPAADRRPHAPRPGPVVGLPTPPLAAPATVGEERS